MADLNNNGIIDLYAWVGFNNFGDELSPYLIERITNCGINITEPNAKNKLVAIGSLLSGETLYNSSSFWGTGCLTQENADNMGFRMFPLKRAVAYCRSKLKPSSFYALRGPLSAQALEKSGIKNDMLPKVFSDPAILIPYVYKPNLTALQHFDLGIILHQQHQDEHPIDESFIQEHYSSGVTTLNINCKNTEDVEHLIDQICSCKLIASTSLHGIIIAQAYGIPAVFLQDLQSPLQKNCVFKFNDYFLGTRQEPQEPIKFTDIKELIPQLLKMPYTDPPSFRDLCQNLLDVFPYQDKLTLKSLPY